MKFDLRDIAFYLSENELNEEERGRSLEISRKGDGRLVDVKDKNITDYNENLTEEFILETEKIDEEEGYSNITDLHFANSTASWTEAVIYEEAGLKNSFPLLPGNENESAARVTSLILGVIAVSVIFGCCVVTLLQRLKCKRQVAAINLYGDVIIERSCPRPDSALLFELEQALIETYHKQIFLPIQSISGVTESSMSMVGLNGVVHESHLSQEKTSSLLIKLKDNGLISITTKNLIEKNVSPVSRTIRKIMVAPPSKDMPELPKPRNRTYMNLDNDDYDMTMKHIQDLEEEIVNPDISQGKRQELTAILQHQKRRLGEEMVKTYPHPYKIHKSTMYP